MGCTRMRSDLGLYVLREEDEVKLFLNVYVGDLLVIVSRNLPVKIAVSLQGDDQACDDGHNQVINAHNATVGATAHTSARVSAIGTRLRWTKLGGDIGGDNYLEGSMEALLHSSAEGIPNVNIYLRPQLK
ncbi:hypothetical protein F444_19348 [Phytophthora nicotianae P1976]|uniref:Reverse transcriptase Ty1/copia-type domain-containing protein n=1 Tax=Phytophthora nicotianae P1976 TaxID=1317066 RepID=A0A080Z843_PHYNI|nr:hypothetical protein F444_19348 [Phytophthora nicotianae P1976]